MDTTESTRKAGSLSSRIIALVGRRDEPTDGVRDYCAWLGDAMQRRAVTWEAAEVLWDQQGWLSALSKLCMQSASWRGRWVLLQYTALMWSRRGFPLGVLAALAILRCRGARPAIVFHEPVGLIGTRWIDRIRGACQTWVMRTLHYGARKSVMTAPLETVGWLSRRDWKVAFIPIGANIPERLAGRKALIERSVARKTVAVFCVSEPQYRQREVEDISHAMRSAVTEGAKLRIVFLGKGTTEAKNEIERAFEGIPVEVSILGLRTADDVSRVLAESDALLCVRGALYPRRGSAIAGIACGLPIIGYAGAAEGTPLAEAGVELVPYGDVEALGVALKRVLTDANHAKELREKSVRAQEEYFSWDSIAAAFLGFLGVKEVS